MAFLYSPTIENRGEPAGFEASKNCHRQFFFFIIMMSMKEKLEKLKRILADYERVAIAFSGGVDSTFLLKVARDTLSKKNVLAVSAYCEFVPSDEHADGEKYCEENDIEYRSVTLEILKTEGVRYNPKDRCYICKKAIFTEIRKKAENYSEQLTDGADFVVCEGSNIDDLSDYRPGLKAIEELQVKSPLREAGLTKADIRALSKELNIPTWDKPSMACLASRFVYGEELTEEKLRIVEEAEKALRNKLGNIQFRVRIHGEKPNLVARIEVPKDKIDLILEMKDLSQELKSIGFAYVTVDMDGFRSGSMNETLGIS